MASSARLCWQWVQCFMGVGTGNWLNMGVQDGPAPIPEPSTLELLREYGVDYAQGNYIGRPREALVSLARMPFIASRTAITRKPTGMMHCTTHTGMPPASTSLPLYPPMTAGQTGLCCVRIAGRANAYGEGVSSCRGVSVEVGGSRLGLPAEDLLGIEGRFAVIRNEREVHGHHSRLAKQCLGQVVVLWQTPL